MRYGQSYEVGRSVGLLRHTPPPQLSLVGNPVDDRGEIAANLRNTPGQQLIHGGDRHRHVDHCIGSPLIVTARARLEAVSVTRSMGHRNGSNTSRMIVLDGFSVQMTRGDIEVSGLIRAQEPFVG